MQDVHTDLKPMVSGITSTNQSNVQQGWQDNIKYLIVGTLFGVVFVKSEIISWFRIQEMFRLQSFHMYGIIGSAVLVGVISVWLIKRFGINHHIQLLNTKIHPL